MSITEEKNEYTENNNPVKAKIVFLDLDGTLLNSQNKISEKSMESILKAREKGVKIVLATGRSISSVKRLIGDFYSQYNISYYPGIYLNGCTVFGDDGSLIVNELLSENVKMEIVHFLKKYQILNCSLWFDHEKIYCTEYNKQTKSLYEDFGEEEAILIKEEEIKSLTIFKVVLCLVPDIFSDLYKKSRENFSGQINVLCPLKNYIEFFSYNVSKFEGVKKICKMYNYSLDDTGACGDGDNDIEMLRGVKYSMAALNAKPEVKKAAKFVGASNDHDCVSHFLKEFCGI